MPFLILSRYIFRNNHCSILNDKGQVYYCNKFDFEYHVPTLIKGLDNVKEIINTDDGLLTINNKGEVYSFDNVSKLPILMEEFQNTIQITSKFEKSLYLNKYGEVYYFDHLKSCSTKIDVKNIIQIGMITMHLLMLNNMGQVYHRFTWDDAELNIVDNLNNIIQISCSDSHALFLDNKGNVYGLGSNNYGELGINGKYMAKNCIDIPTLIPSLNNIIEIAAGEHHSLVLDNTGKIYSFGYNNHLQLGNCSIRLYRTPKVIPDIHITI